jgi:hypothetical protein
LTGDLADEYAGDYTGDWTADWTGGLLPRFGLAPGRLAPEHPLPGSPERAIARYAVADAQGRAWMLERIGPGQAARREELAGLLAALARDPELGPLVPAWRPTVQTTVAATVSATVSATRSATRSAAPLATPPRYVLRQDEPPNIGLWMVSPFVAGSPLPRPDYLDHAWRGRALAGVLLALQRAGAGLADAGLPGPGLAGSKGFPAGAPDERNAGTFGERNAGVPGERTAGALEGLPVPPQPDLAAYAGSFFNALERRAPGLLPRLAPVRRALAGLAGAEAACAPALAHGDPHPLNVIWGEAGARPVRALIDWEFAGLRPRTYDAAVVLGCAGFEHPSGLTRAFALGLARTLAEGGLPTAELRLLPLFVLALRLGWLAEWLRKRDAELVAMELEYLDILLDAQARLARVWAGG